MLNILLEEKKRHPAAGVRDYCKLLYQSEFGAGHMVSGADASLERLRAECAACGVGGGRALHAGWRRPFAAAPARHSLVGPAP